MIYFNIISYNKYSKFIQGVFAMKKILIVIVIIISILTSCQPATQKVQASKTPPTPMHSDVPTPTKMKVVATSNSFTQSTFAISNADSNKVVINGDCNNVFAAMSEQDEIRYLIYCFDSAWIDYVNKDDNKVFDYISKSSPAYKIAKNFNKSNIKEQFLELEVYSVYVNGSTGYAAVYEKLKKNSKEKTYKWVYKLVRDSGIWKIHSFNSSVPSELFDQLAKHADNDYKEEYNYLADVISRIWMINEKTSFNKGGYLQDLAYIRLGEGIEEYSKIRDLQPQDGAQTHIKDSWWLDIASMHIIIGNYKKAHEIYDAIIKFNDCNVVGACIGKAEVYRRQGDVKDMKKWLNNAEVASDNGDMLP